MNLDIDFVNTNIEEIVKNSDILCTATSIDIGSGPLFSKTETKPHLHINAVGSDFPGKVEIPFDLLQKCFVCPDFIEQAIVEGECQQLEQKDIGAGLVEVAQNSDKYAYLQNERSVFDSTGWALEDKVVMDLFLDCASELEDETKNEPWSALVPLRASGSKLPVFCLHGGGHVFYLKDLAKHLGADQPVYALQKLGLNEVEPVIHDVKTMASNYLSEIRRVQPKGPYSVIGYCLSAPICYEIALQLNKMGEACALVGIIDSRRTPNYFHKSTVKEKIHRFTKMMRGNDWSFVTEVLRQRLINPTRDRLTYLAASPQSKKEADLWNMTNAILEEYVWKPYPGKIALFATKQRQEDQMLNYMIDDWTPLAQGGLDVVVVSGNHGAIFYEPEVEHLAEQLRQCLDKANKRCG